MGREHARAARVVVLPRGFNPLSPQWGESTSLIRSKWRWRRGFNPLSPQWGESTSGWVDVRDYEGVSILSRPNGARAPKDAGRRFNFMRFQSSLAPMGREHWLPRCCGSCPLAFQSSLAPMGREHARAGQLRRHRIRFNPLSPQWGESTRVDRLVGSARQVSILSRPNGARAPAVSAWRRSEDSFQSSLAPMGREHPSVPPVRGWGSCFNPLSPQWGESTSSTRSVRLPAPCFNPLSPQWGESTVAALHDYLLQLVSILSRPNGARAPSARR